MKIYITENLSYLRQGLSDRGFEIINNSQDGYDAAICNLKDINLTELNYKNNRADGTLIIDSGSKNINDIENILTNKNNT